MSESKNDYSGCIGGTYRHNLWSIAMGGVCAMFLSASVSAHHSGFQDRAGSPSVPGNIQPHVYEGNPTCSDLSEMQGIDGLLEVKLHPEQYLSNPYVDITLGSGNTFSWSNFNGQIQGIFVKGGPIGGNMYDYRGTGISADGNLHSPLHPRQNKFSGLSHISFCYLPGSPDITVEKSCPSAPQLLNNGVDGARYTYEVKVTNSGDGVLDNFMVDDSLTSVASCNITNVPQQLGEDAMATISVVCDSATPLPNNGYNEVTVTADTEFGHQPTVSDDSNASCPDFAPPSVVIEKSCADPMIRLVEVDTGEATILGVQACVDIRVTNNGNDETLTNVVLVDDIALDQNLPINDLAPGAYKDLNICYYPSMPTGETLLHGDGIYSPFTVYMQGETPEALFSNTAVVMAEGVFSGAQVSDDDDAHCSICVSNTPGLPSECPSPDMNPYLLTE
ncbi:hypothetical protein [Aliamphritea ceti]|uniref:hypothetical protein n=1 Tax=Aliamphritea ceti TaxID=1524258 RepID=UPI0021C47181|nr:hypothetical protein [Aliamphritea ceti]